MIDWNRVIELRDQLGPEELLPIIDMILVEIEAHLFALDSRTLHLAEDLHLLRGLALNIGFAEFCAQCLRAEQQLALFFALEHLSVVGGLICAAIASHARAQKNSSSSR